MGDCKTMQYHEVANIFPLMSGEEFQALKADIQQNGLRESIWTYQNKIIDGRNRFKACQEIGVTPKFKEWDGNGSLVSFVVSLNLQRRHLNSSQKAVIAAELLPMLEQEAKKRQQEHGNTAPGQKSLSQKIEQVNDGKSTEQAAQIMHTNRQYVSDVKQITQKAPEIIEKVKEGKLTLPEAKQVSKLSEPKRQEVIEKIESKEVKNVREAVVKINKEESVRLKENPIPIPAGKYQTIEIDPPWKLDGEEGKSQVLQYPLMETEEIIQLGSKINEMADDNCHLYLWSINPMLPEAFKVVEAWKEYGFIYKSCLTWVKTNGFGTGHYLRGATEHALLLVKGRLDTLRNDQRTYFEAPKPTAGNHSAKPEEFYKIVEELSPGPRIRMFARSSLDGWTSWGNQIDDK